MGKKVLFFGNGGVDDAMAIIYAHVTENIELVGIVANYGNVSREMAIRNAHYLLQFIGRKDVPVIEGADKPMSGKRPSFFYNVHGPYGLGQLIPPIEPLTTQPFSKIIDIIERYPNEIVIVNTGSLTALASAFLLLGEYLKSVTAFYIMGGAFIIPGNVTSVAEANFYHDPIAADLVMQYASHATIFPLNVTHKAIVTPEMIDYIHQKGKSPLVKPMWEHYYKFYQQVEPTMGGTPIHDVLPMIAVTHGHLFSYVSLPVHIVHSEGRAYGQSIADFRTTKKIEEDRPSHRIAMDVNYELFIRHYMSVMTGQTF